MGTQVAIIGLAFIIFGALAWIFGSFSIAYVGLMLFGLAALAIGFFLARA